MAESSRALPAGCYGDPALIAERNELRDMGCKACDLHGLLLGRVTCTEPRMTQLKKVPFIGSKCKYFKLKEIP